MGRGLPRVPGMDSCLRRNDGCGVVVPAEAGTQRGEWGGASPAPQGWIPAFAGMTVGASSCPRKRVPRGGNGAGPPPRPRDGFLLGGRNDGWGVVVPAEAGTQRGEWGGGLPRVPGMDSCLRRNGCYKGVAAHALTTPAKAGVYRSW